MLPSIRLKAYYISHGYFEAQFDYQVETDSETNEVTIIIDDPGRAFRKNPKDCVCRFYR